MSRHILLIKTSSFGDVVHALPALTEACAMAEVNFSWVVEEDLVDIPAMHTGVSEVIPVAIRRWRNDWWGSRAEIGAFLTQLRSKQYDLVIDSQGLLKSAIIASLAKGAAHGYAKSSARESQTSMFYAQTHEVGKSQHAIARQRQLFAAALGYHSNSGAGSNFEVDYGLAQHGNPSGSIVLFHGTTWTSKEWPIQYWCSLANLIRSSGHDIVIPSGNAAELRRAGEILGSGAGRILDRLPLNELIKQLRNCVGAVSVDTGLGHLAPALGIPTVGMFGATSPDLTGILGPRTQTIVSDHLPCIPCRKRDCQFSKPEDSSNIYPPCFQPMTPETVWQALQQQIGSKVIKPD